MSRKHDSGVSGFSVAMIENRDMEEQMEEDMEEGKSREAQNEFRLAWMFVEGWRARLRKGGDIIEKERHVWDVVKTRPVYHKH